jgi:hypothetical protein
MNITLLQTFSNLRSFTDLAELTFGLMFEHNVGNLLK